MNKFYVNLLIAMLFVANCFSQSSNLINAALTPEQQKNYSKAVQMIQGSSLMKRINDGAALTILLPENYALTELPAAHADKLFNKKDAKEIEDFISLYTIDQKHSAKQMYREIEGDKKDRKISNKTGQQLSFTNNGNMLMITSKSGFEVNVLDTVTVKNSILYLLSGRIK